MIATRNARNRVGFIPNLLFAGVLFGWLWAVWPPNAVAQISAESAPFDKIDVAINSCAAAFNKHRIATHTDAMICANGPITKAFQEANFPDMNLIFKFEGASLDAASKLGHRQITESDFRAAIAQASLQLKAQEAEISERRRATLPAQTSPTPQLPQDDWRARVAAAQAQVAREQEAAYAAAAAADAERAAKEERRRSIVMQVIENNRRQEQQQQENLLALQRALSEAAANSRGTHCTTTFAGGAAFTACH